MTDTINYHGTPEQFEHQIKNVLTTALNNGIATEQDVSLISKYVDEEFACGKICPCRRKKLVCLLLKNLEYFDSDYSSATIDDIYSASLKIRTAKKSNGDPYSPNSVHDHIWMLRKFALWVYESGYSTAIPEINPEKIRAIKIPRVKRDNVRPEDIPTDEECLLILKYANSAKYRCMYSFMIDGGFRSIEVASLKFSQIRPSRYGLLVELYSNETKTGKHRSVPLYDSSQYYSDYLSQRGKHGPNDYVFVDERSGLPLKYPALDHSLKMTLKRAGITRHIHLHLFRHRYVTTNLERGMQESAISLIVWGIPHSSCMSTYSHYRLEELEDEGARARGIKVKSKRKKRESSVLAPRQCLVCGTMNESHRVTCKVCNAPLLTDSIKAREELKRRLMDAMVQDPSLWKAVMSAFNNQNSIDGC